MPSGPVVGRVPTPAVRPRTFQPAPSAMLTSPPVAAATPGLPEDTKSGTGAILLHVLLGIDLGFLALNAVFGVFIGCVLMFAPDTELARDMRELVGTGIPTWGDFWFGLIAMGIIPLVWILLTRRAWWLGTVRYLDLRFDVGVLWRAGVLLVAMLLLYGLIFLVSVTLPEVEAIADEAYEEDLRRTSWALIIAASLAAGLTEEILFRGILQRWIGWWGQAFVFSAVHFAAGSPYQIVFSLLIGLGFGWLRKRGWSVVTLILAHGIYDVFAFGVMKVTSP